jgi:tetratricopeptide (TPR) repeat protein
MVRSTAGRLAATAVAAIVMLAYAAGAGAQVTGMVKGKVTDASGAPVADAKVTIVQKGNKTGREVKTGKKGDFVQMGLNPGIYVLTAEKGDLKGTLETQVHLGDAEDTIIKIGHAGPSPEAAAKSAALQKSFDEGVALSKAGKHDEAIAKFNETLALAPSCQDCYYNIGFSNIQKKDYAAAEASFKKALELKPDYVDAWNGLANVYNSQGKTDLALEASNKAAQYSAGAGAAAGGTAGGGGGGASAGTLYNQGVILWNAGKYPEAKEKFEAATKADPNNADAQYRLGMANVNLGDMAGAVSAFEAYLKAAPSGPHADEVKGFIAAMKK